MLTVVTVIVTVALLASVSAIVSAHEPAATALMVTVLPATLAVTIPLQPVAVYKPATPPETVTVCVPLVAPLNVSVDGKTESAAGDDVEDGTGEAEGDAGEATVDVDEGEGDIPAEAVLGAAGVPAVPVQPTEMLSINIAAAKDAAAREQFMPCTLGKQAPLACPRFHIAPDAGLE